MGDIDIAGAVDGVTMAEVVSRYMGIATSVYDSSSIAEDVTAPVRYFEMFRDANICTIGYVDRDWVFTDNYARYKDKGVNLKGLILMPGSGAPDTFMIKHGADTGPIIYYGAVSVATVLVYPGTVCKPMIDYSLCTLSAGHKITFVW